MGKLVRNHSISAEASHQHSSGAVSSEKDVRQWRVTAGIRDILQPIYR